MSFWSYLGELHLKAKALIGRAPNIVNTKEHSPEAISTSTLSTFSSQCLSGMRVTLAIRRRIVHLAGGRADGNDKAHLRGDAHPDHLTLMLPNFRCHLRGGIR